MRCERAGESTGIVTSKSFLTCFVADRCASRHLFLTVLVVIFSSSHPDGA